MSTVSSSFSLTDKVALVTGGTTGIGLATARAYHAAGARVVVTGRSLASIEQARRDLPDDILVLQSDARSLADAAALAATIGQKFGRLDVAFLNAGIARFAPLEGTDEDFYDDIMDTNVKGVLFTIQKLLPLLSSGASIVVNTSVVNVMGVANTAVYSASKGAVAAAVRALAAELAGRGIRVNAVSPGPIATPIFGKLGLPAETLAGFHSTLTEKIPLHRFGGADEVAQVALFLASPAASFITGAELPVDGGISAT